MKDKYKNYIVYFIFLSMPRVICLNRNTNAEPKIKTWHHSNYEFITHTTETPINEAQLVTTTATPKFVFEKASIPMSVLREKYIIPPPGPGHKLNLEWPWFSDRSQLGQPDRIMEILGHKRNGFFVECGAFDGEALSNTLMMERYYNWTGLLIEPDTDSQKRLVKKNRNVYLSNSCLSVRTHPIMVSFKMENLVGKITQEKSGKKLNHIKVPCFPIYMLLQAINRTTVDYFSLDVEGSELEVLQTIPWDKVDIRTLSVEYSHGTEGKEAMRKYMKQQGYFVHSQLPYGKDRGSDFIFVKAN